MKVGVSSIPLERVGAAFEKFFPLLEMAVDASYGRWSMGKLRMRLATADAQLWVVTDDDKEAIIGVVVTEVVTQADGIVVTCPLMAGKDYKEWVAEVTHLEEFARSIGAHRLETFARPGSAKLLKEVGFEEMPRRLMFKNIIPRKEYH